MVLAAISLAGFLLPRNDDNLFAAGVLGVAFGFWLGRARLYSSRFITRRSDEIRRIVDAGMLSAATVGATAYALKIDPGRGWVVLGSLFSIIGLVIERELIRRRFATKRRSGELTRRVLLIGDNHESDSLAKMFAEEADLGYEVVASLDPEQLSREGDLTTSVLASARTNGASGAVICASGIDSRANNRLIRDLIEAGIHVELSSTLADIEPSRLTVRPLGRFPVVYVEPVVRNGWRKRAKRLFDLTLAACAMLAAAPIMAVIALAIRRSSPGPVLFKQSRIGRNGVPFDVLKFRTMVVDAEERLAELLDENEGAGPLFKMKNDPRVTRLADSSARRRSMSCRSCGTWLGVR
ncbi:MAG: sugar transferase [Acidimicrobiales bacterium]